MRSWAFLKSSGFRGSIVKALSPVIGLMTCCMKLLSFWFLPVKPPRITRVSYNVKDDVAYSPFVGGFNFFYPALCVLPEFGVISQPVDKNVNVYVVVWFVHHFLFASTANSSRSWGHLVIWKVPAYFSAMDSAGSMMMVASFVLILTYVPGLTLAAFRIFLGIMTLPFSSILTVVSLINFPH